MYDVAPESPAQPASLLDWERALNWDHVVEEGVEMLCQYLRFPTVNDPDRLDVAQAEHEPWRAGNEAEAAAWLADWLRREGIAVKVFEAAPGRCSVVARLSGSSQAASITLLSHSDVVPATRAEWAVDPFGGIIHDGYMYGRGALDLKGLGIAQVLTCCLIQRLKLPLKRDVVLIIAADEEAGGHFGVERLLQQQPNLADTDVVLGEGGYSPQGLLPNSGTIHAIAIAEKGYLELELLAEQAAHHASMPGANSAPQRLVRALHRVLSLKHPIQITSISEILLQQLANSSSGLHRMVLRRPRLAAGLAPNRIARTPLISAMLHDTVALTILESGYKSNVIPGQARAVLSIRFLPATDPAELTERIRRVIADDAIQIRQLRYKPANASSHETPLFHTLAKSAVSTDARAVVAPILSPAASDSRYWRLRGVNCYGWVPFAIPAGDLHSVHGPNERLSIAAFNAGLRSLYRAVIALAADA